MKLTIKQVATRDGQDRFVLVHPKTREVMTVHDVHEAALRRFLTGKGVERTAVDAALARARQRYEAQHASRREVDEASDTDDELLFELGLGGDDSS